MEGEDVQTKKPRVPLARRTLQDDDSSEEENGVPKVPDRSKPAIKKDQHLVDLNTRVPLFTHAVLSFECSQMAKVRNVTLVKEFLEDGDDSTHIKPQHRQDFDRNKFYYAKSYCPKDCSEDHYHDPYLPATILHLESE